MHFLKKMMTVVIMLMAVLGGQGWYAAIATTYVDFPHDQADPTLQTPGHSGIVQHNVEEVVIPRYDPPIPIPRGHDRFTYIKIALGGDQNANIYFPVDGRQPTTQEAAEWSCARVGADNPNHPVTEWYMRMFGWAPTGGVTLQMGFTPLAEEVKVPTTQDSQEIIRLDDTMEDQLTDITNPAGGDNFTRREAFWDTFRQIASKPVGRVLLYRLLIEIRREDGQANGSCENGIQIGDKLLRNRNQCRSIYVSHNTNDRFSFSQGEERCIEFGFHEPKTRTLRINANHTIDTDDDNDTLDIGLFHEMLHWFHYLRHPKRETHCDSKRPKVYKYALRSYYGDPSELCTWGSAVNEEEIRTILGTPDYRNEDHLNLIPQEAFLTVNPVNGVNVMNNRGFIPFESRFLEGDDLSENAYRMSVLDPEGKICRMRFGHGYNINPVPIQIVIPDRFRLAYLVATDCYREITGQPIQNWNLAKGEAAQ